MSTDLATIGEILTINNDLLIVDQQWDRLFFHPWFTACVATPLSLSDDPPFLRVVEWKVDLV